MKKHSLLKQIIAFALVALAFILLTTTVRAEVGSQSFGITNTIAATLTNSSSANCGSAVYIGNQDNASLEFYALGSGAGTSNVTFTFVRSKDGTTWETSPTLTWTFASAGLSTNCVWTNLPQASIGAAGYLKVSQVANVNPGSLTNCSLTLVKKTVKLMP